MSDMKLYGLPGDEHLEDDPEEVFQRWLDDGGRDDVLVVYLAIEERSTVPWTSLLPSVERVLDHLVDCMSDEAIDGDAMEALEDIANELEIKQAFQFALDTLAKRMGDRYNMAGDLLRTILVTEADGKYLMDGVPFMDVEES